MSIDEPSQSDGCECQQIVELTAAGDISTLDQKLESSLANVLTQNKFYLYRATDKLCLISNAKVKTTFDICDQPTSIVRLVVEGNMNDGITQKIASLLKVYQNQHLLISRINSDQLTKLGNRLALESKFSELFGLKDSNRRKRDRNICVAIFDIDHFKSINDKFGHLYGDEVLVHLSQLMVKSFRDSDFLFRYGGEEFVVVLTDIELALAESIMDRFREKVEKYDFPLVGCVTISVGLASVEQDADSITSLGRADKALYFSKQNGRNQLNSYERLIEQGHLVNDKPAEDDITLFT